MWVTGVIFLWTAITSCLAVEDLPWWRTAHLYQVYPRSFKDNKGDGVGTFKGIIEKAEYFKDIGTTAIWLSPIFKSPMGDMGYDISDYRTVDPTFGTNEDLVELINTLHKLGIKILLDLVPNHTSDEHEWFQKSVKREDPYTDYYVWVDGKTDSDGNKIPPNNWVSNFTGSAWEWNEQRKQYYYHQFMVKQPDLNFRNPHVCKEMDEIICYWLEKGVDGFRVDAVPFLFEHKDMKDNPEDNGVVVGNTYTENQPETYEMVNHWAELVYNHSKKDGIERALFVEAYATLKQTLSYYGKGVLSLVQPFNFFLLTKCNRKSRPKHFKDVIMNWVDNMPPGAMPNWVISNHDNSRAADRFGFELVDALNLLTMVLPGCKVTYYGDEIGMRDTFVRWEQTVDPAARMQGPEGYLKVTRDPERSPMQWDDSDNAGFSTSCKTWLPVNPNYWELNVAAQTKAKTSHLKVFQAMAKAREDPVLRLGDLSVIVHNDDTLVVVRSYNNKKFVLIINMSSCTEYYTTDNFFTPNGLNEDLNIVTSSINTGLESGQCVKKGEAQLRLRPQGAVLLKSSEGN